MINLIVSVAYLSPQFCIKTIFYVFLLLICVFILFNSYDSDISVYYIYVWFETKKHFKESLLEWAWLLLSEAGALPFLSPS